MTNELKTTRFFELDYLRGIAAISVVLFHYTYGYDNGLKILESGKFYFRYGNLGVQLFFIISGYVIFMTLNKIEKPTDFVISRFSRLYPAYWFAILFSLFFVSVVDNPFQYHNVTFNRILINLTMFQHWFRVKDIDGAYWTLYVELTFYIIMLVLYIFKQLKNVELLSLFWLSLSCIFILFEIPYGKYVSELLILKHSPLFIAGIILYRFKNIGDSLSRYILLLFSLLTELLIQYTVYKLITPLIIIFSIYTFFLFLVKNKIKFNKSRILNFFGAISYSLYLIHENIGMAIIYNLRKILDHQIFYIPITLTIVIIFAYFMTYYIERPSMKLLKVFFQSSPKYSSTKFIEKPDFYEKTKS